MGVGVGGIGVGVGGIGVGVGVGSGDEHARMRTLSNVLAKVAMKSIFAFLDGRFMLFAFVLGLVM